MRPVVWRRETSRRPLVIHACCCFPTTSPARNHRHRSPSSSIRHSSTFSIRYDPVKAKHDTLPTKAPVDVLQAYSNAHSSGIARQLTKRLNSRLKKRNYDPEEIPGGSSVVARRERLSTILQGGQPDQILAAMSDLDNEPIISTMPDSVFVSALLLITPEHFLEPYKRILGRIHDHVLFSKGYQSFKEVLRQYFASLFTILYMRSRGDRHVGLVEYTHLLRCAASAADLSIALTIWKSLENKNLSPSLECYNSIMTTGLWDQVHTGKERYRLRVTPFYSNRRSATDGRARGYRGFGTGSQSVRMQTLAILYQMRKANIDTDEATHINALIAHAKDGFVPGVRQVLEETWGIFPFHLDAGYENHPPVKPIPRSSPLYPTINLIWAVAHAFGINHDLPTALRTVEFISRTYDIKITDEVWLELFERAYVLAAKQFNKPDEALLGQISQDLVYGMGRNLQEVPSHSKMHLYRNLSRISYNNHNLEEFTSVLEDAHKHLVQTKKRRKHALQVLENCMEVSLTVDPHRASVDSSPDHHRLENACKSPKVWKALREYEILRLEVLQQRTLIERIVRLGYSGHFLKEIPPAMWARKVLPEFLAQWRDFIPECFFAILHGGLGSIEFHGRTIYQHRNIRPHNYEPVRWSKCGEFIADGEEFEPIDDYLWSSIRSHLGEYASVEPFVGFFRRNWRRMDAPGENHLYIHSQESRSVNKYVLKGRAEAKSHDIIPECYLGEAAGHPSGLSRVFSIVESDMKDGSFRVDLEPSGRWV